MDIDDVKRHSRNPEAIENMMNRASVRKFRDQEVSKETVAAIVRAGQQAPFTGQMYSIIATDDDAKREDLREIFGPLAQKAPLFTLLCVDLRKLEKFIAHKDRTNNTDDLSMLFLAIQDVAYMGQNMVLAAEAMGLGSCFLGAAPFAAAQLREMFSLPKRVYPLVGLVLGYPAEDPEPRPRIPVDCVLHWDEYEDLDEDDVEAALEVMDAGLIREGYYKRLNARISLQKEEDDVTDQQYGWGEHVSRKYSRGRLGLKNLLFNLQEADIEISRPTDGQG